MLKIEAMLIHAGKTKLKKTQRDLINAQVSEVGAVGFLDESMFQPALLKWANAQLNCGAWGVLHEGVQLGIFEACVAPGHSWVTCRHCRRLRRCAYAVIGYVACFLVIQPANLDSTILILDLAAAP